MRHLDDCGVGEIAIIGFVAMLLVGFTFVDLMAFEKRSPLFDSFTVMAIGNTMESAGVDNTTSEHMADGFTQSINGSTYHSNIPLIGPLVDGIAAMLGWLASAAMAAVGFLFMALGMVMMFVNMLWQAITLNFECLSPDVLGVYLSTFIKIPIWFSEVAAVIKLFPFG